MATLAEHPAVAPSTFDQDIESFLDLDQLAYTSAEPARAKTALAAQPTLPSTEFNAGDVRSAGFASTTSQQAPIAFQGPSHQYDEHKQQTGLPPGALAHAMTFNNHMNGMGYGAPSPGFPMGGDLYPSSQLKREEPSMDFNSPPTRNTSDMDLESDNMGSVPGYFISPNPSNKSQFVDPNALGGHEMASMGPSTQVGRMYPGMHQQQAAMAKAAQQQKHNEYLRQQHLQQQRRMDEHMHHNAAPHSQTPRPSNPAVEERISRLLQQMRQSALNSPDDSPSPPSLLPQMAKAKKEEQDMDEDERLLASEEGKKLSSKERRQLRNKVSARAFRSRRKEYIGQLESEVAAKTNEAHELRLQNRSLFEENARLTDLARMLLSSPHFSSFLDEMGPNGLPLPSQVQSQPHPQHHQHPQHPQQAQPQQQPPQQQAPAMTQPPMQQAPPVGMVMVPNQGLDVSAMGMNNGGWNSGIDMNYGNPSVFAVLEVPEPAIDTEALSGKTSSIVDSCLPSVASSKDEAPVLASMPAVAETEQKSDVGVENPDVVMDESDPAFALFADMPAATTSQGSACAFDGIATGKSAFELVVEGEVKDSAQQFAHLCHSMEAAFERVSMMTAHLS